MSAGFRFLSWVREGMAAGGTAADPGSGDLPSRAAVRLQVRFAQDEVGTAGVDLRLMGPGDVTGIDPAQVIRAEPRPDSQGYSPNYFAFVEFDRPDYPWVFTPASPGAHGRLRPWLALVVVPDDHSDVVLDTSPARPLPTLTCPRGELPDPAESWAWAHAQVAVTGPGEAVETVIEKYPDRTLSRLVCPRRLRARTRYLACVVPAFEAGRVAGLGDDPRDAGAGPAWGRHDPVQPLPVYFHWRFSTGDAGDFEALASRLRARPLGPETGIRPMYIGDAGVVAGPPQDPDAPGAVLGMEGALRSPDALPTPWPEPARGAFRASLAAMWNEPAGRLAPPLYGAVHAGVDGLPAPHGEPHWLRELNLDPRHRAAAALGTRIVQQQQEQLIASAWRQAVEVSRANQLLRHGELAREAQAAGFEKRLPGSTTTSARTAASASATAETEPVSSGRVLQLAAPVLDLVATRTGTVDEALEARPAAAAATSPAFRRVARPRGALARRLAGTAPLADPVGALAAGGIVAVPPLEAPAGMVSMEALPGSAQLSSVTPEFVSKALRWWAPSTAAAAKAASAASIAALSAPAPEMVASAPSARTAWGTWFVTTWDGNLWELAWSAGRWAWMAHGAPPGIAVGPVDPVPFGGERRIFVAGRLGHMLERWHDGDQWRWRSHGLTPGGRGLSAEPGAVTGSSVFATTADGALWELRRTAPETWEWFPHFSPTGDGVLGRPQLMGGDVMVRTASGTLFRRVLASGTWVSQGTPCGLYQGVVVNTTVAQTGPAPAHNQLFLRGRDGNLWMFFVAPDGMTFWENYGNPGAELNDGPWGVFPGVQTVSGRTTVYANAMGGQVHALVRAPDADVWTWEGPGVLPDGLMVRWGGMYFEGRGPVVPASDERLHIWENPDGQGTRWITLPAVADTRGAGGMDDPPVLNRERWALPLGFLSNLLVAHADNPERENAVWVRLGRRMDFEARVESWSDPARILPPAGESIGWETQGLGIAVARLGGGAQRDLVVLYVDNPGGLNTLYYRVGYDVDRLGRPSSWSPRRAVPLPVAAEVQGADIALADLDGDGRLELVVLYATGSRSPNRLFYRIGWGLDADGNATGGWTDSVEIPWAFAGTVAGVGVAVADLNRDGAPDLVVLTVETGAPGGTQVRYRVGKKVNARGRVTGEWAGYVSVPALGEPWGSAYHGAGLAVADFTGNRFPDVVVFTVENRPQENLARWRMGVDVNGDGVSPVWRGPHLVPGWIGWENAGAAVALADVDPEVEAEREAMGNAFQTAAGVQQKVILDGQARARAPEPPVVQVDPLAERARAALEPGAAITGRVLARVSVGGARAGSLRPLVAAPSYPQPMYRELAALSPELLFPGVGKVEPESVALLRGNPAFIESFMVGLNHEMARELLWREFPAHRRATFFRQFWDVRGAAPGAGPLTDIPPIEAWDPDDGLGAASTAVGAADMLVLVVRGELLRRFPNTLVYARRADWSDDGSRRVLADDVLPPQFRGELEPDLVFFGLPLTPEDAAGSTTDAGWFIVFQQPPTEPRFGLDEASTYTTAAPAAWQALHWGHLAAGEAQLESFGHLRLANRDRAWMSTRLPLREHDETVDEVRAEWGLNAAHMAQITFQPPAQVAIHATDLLPPAEDQWRVAGVRLEEPDGRIVEVGGPRAAGGQWRMPVEAAVAAIERGERFYVEQPAGHRVAVVVARTRGGRAYLKTEADSELQNNLMSLPPLGEEP